MMNTIDCPYKIGQKVICIDDPHDGFVDHMVAVPRAWEKHKVYTVVSIYKSVIYCNVFSLEVKENINDIYHTFVRPFDIAPDHLFEI